MARGYPEPKEKAEPMPTLVAPGLCIICKKRPAKRGASKCAECEAALARP